MATAYYLAAHGAHFPMVHTEAVQPPSSPPSHSELGVHDQTPHVPPPAAIKTSRADSVISDPGRSINDQQTSLFFRLPAELRNQIYTDLLSAGTPSNLTHLTLSPRIPAPTPTYPAILRTCKRIHAEAEPLLYTLPIFHAHPSLLTSLPHLGPPSKPILHAPALARIRRWQLTLRLDTDPRFSAQQARAAFSGAEFLELRVWQSTFHGCSAGVLRLFTGVREVGVCRVVGSVEEGLARWLEGVMMGREEAEECACCGERWARCGVCEGRVRLDGNGAGFWGDEGDAWRFGNR